MTAEIRQLARNLLEDKFYRRSLRRRLIDGRLGALEVVLWHYAYGKPKEPIEMGGTEEGATNSRIVFYIPDNHRDGRP